MVDNTKRKLFWEKWVDPLGSNINDFEFPGAIGTPETDELMEEDDDEYDNTKIQLPGRGMKLIYTQFGILPVTDYTNPDKNFNLWTAHTNFNISSKIQKAIESVPGVESLTIFSRYRFRIGVGKLFDATEVKLAIQKAIKIDNNNGIIDNIIIDDELDNSIRVLREEISKKHKYWAIYVVPNGEINSIGTNEESEAFKQKLELYKTTQAGVGGALFTNYDNK